MRMPINERLKMNRPRTRIILSVLLATLIGICGTSAGVCQDKAAVAAKSASEMDLPDLLRKAAEYCRRLEGSILDFFCREEIDETIDVTLDADRPTAPMSEWRVGGSSGGNITLVQGKVRRFRNSYVYDYQCIRADRVLTEKRTLLKEGREKRNISDAKLELSGFTYFNSLLSPINLFGEKSQLDYDFRIIGKEKFKRQPVLVVEAKLKDGVTATNCLSGKAWIEPETANILKMELTVRPTGGLEMFAQREAQYNRKLRLTLRSEFSAEKNGIRFPSSILIEEAYLNDLGRVFVRSKTEVVYKDFKFFTVTTESQIIR
jgi:hypothetical protein